MRLTEPRVAPVSDEAATARQMEIMKSRGANGGLNVYRTMVNVPDLAEAFLTWGGYVLSDRNDLPGRQREILVLRTGYLCRSGYEWTQHVRVGKRMGLTDEEIVWIKEGAGAKGWSAADATLMRVADELHADQFISEATWAELGAHFTPKQMMDAIFTCGQYTQVSMFLNTCGVQLDPGQVLDPDLKAY